MQSILKKKASPALFETTLIGQMEEDDYKIFDFIGKEKIFDVIKGKTKNTCTVIFTDRLGARYFSFRFIDSENTDHIYGRYIDQINEEKFYNILKETK